MKQLIFGISFFVYVGAFMVSVSVSIAFLVNCYTSTGASTLDFVVPFWLSLLSWTSSILGCIDLITMRTRINSKVGSIIFSVFGIIFWFVILLASFSSLISYALQRYIGSIITVVLMASSFCGIAAHFSIMLTTTKKEEYQEITEYKHLENKNLLKIIFTIGCHISTCTLFGIYLLLVLVFSSYAMISTVEQTSLFHYHGEKFDINALTNYEYANNQSAGYSHSQQSWKMHIYCTGNNTDEKTPTVLLSHGGGASYLSLFSIQKIVSKYTQVCSFDRSGYGYSDFGTFPRRIDQYVAELHQLLEKKKINKKILFVGHSAGGNEAQFFAYKYPSKVAGIMRMDSPHELYYMYEGLSKGMTADQAIHAEQSRAPLIDILRHLSVFGLARIFTNGRGFEDANIGAQHASLYGTKNWNSQYWDFKGIYDSDLLLNSSRWDNTPQSNGVPGQMFGDISLHVVRAGNNEFNKTCDDLQLEPNSEDCKQQEIKRKVEVWLLDDYVIRSSNSKLIVCQECDHGFVTNKYAYAADLVLNQLKEIQNKM